MIVVGLTGGIGSGKSMVAQLFSQKGIPVYNSDTHAKSLMVSNPDIVLQLKKKFGSDIIQNEQLNRQKIAQQIFENKEILQWINNLVHPVVNEDFNRWCNLQKEAVFCIKEAAILIESGAFKQCNRTIVVTAPESLRIERVMARDKVTAQQVQARIKNQLTDKERIKYADFIITNDGLHLLQEQVDKIYHQLINTHKNLNSTKP